MQAILQEILATGKYNEQDIAAHINVSVETIRRIKKGVTKKPRCRTAEKLFSLYFSIQHLLRANINTGTPIKEEKPRPHLPKILLVEDIPLVQKAHNMLLQELGYTADLAKNGKEAIERATKDDYDIIFMDIGLPDINGIEVTKEIRHSVCSAKGKCLIVALTAYDIDEISSDCMAAGMDIVESKPICIKTLQAIISRAMHKQMFQRD